MIVGGEFIKGLAVASAQSLSIVAVAIFCLACQVVKVVGDLVVHEVPGVSWHIVCQTGDKLVRPSP